MANPNLRKLSNFAQHGNTAAGYGDSARKTKRKLKRVINKSFVPGKGWIAATKLTAREASKVPGAHSAAKGVSKPDLKFKTRREGLEVKLHEHGGGFVQNKEHAGAASTIRYGGKKTGFSFIQGHAPDARSRDRLMAHEGQHAAVNRTSYRLHGQIMSDPKKMFREEARADIQGSGRHYTEHRNPQTSTTYEALANSRKKAVERPNHPGVNSRIVSEMTGAPRFNNAQWHENLKGRAGFVGNHYRKGKMDDNIDAYRHVQDKIQAARQRKVQKSFVMPGDDLRSEVSKMSPDQADLHVMGGSNGKTRGRLKKYPKAVRRV